MTRYLLQRLTLTVPILFGVTLLTFTISHLMPQDPARVAAGLWASEEVVEKRGLEFGLDRPLHEQYFRYMSHLIRGDFGRSMAHSKPVLELIKRYMPATVELALVSLLLGGALGVLLGVISAFYKDSAMDHVFRLIALVGLSFPQFWLGLAIQIIFYRHLRWFPATGRLDSNILPPPTVTGLYLVDSVLARNLEAFLSSLHHIVMPAFVLALPEIAAIMRMQRATMLEVMTQEYIRVARAKGLSERMVVYRHALKNSLIPVITIIGSSVGAMLGGSFVVETIFGWPGMGRLAVHGIVWSDYNPIMALAIILGLSYSIVNLSVDLLYGFFNPKIRYA